MNFWFTTKWPGSPHNQVCEVAAKRSALTGMAVGDIVFVYESKTGKTISGSSPAVGREGIVAIGEVTSPVGVINLSTTQYTDGTSSWWRYGASLKTICATGIVHRVDVNSTLGYKPGNRLRGCGAGHSGVKRLTAREAQTLKKLFCPKCHCGLTI